MKQQEGRNGPTTTLIAPELRLVLRLQEPDQRSYDLDVFAYSGNHCFMHRLAHSDWDVCDEMQIHDLLALAKWAGWFATFAGWRQLARRLPGANHAPIPPLWPLPPETQGSQLRLKTE